MTLKPLQFTQESALESNKHQEIHHFWLNGTFNSFKGKDNIRINYATFQTPRHQRNLVIVPGRVEGYLKYKELAFDLFNQGYNIFILDHRGQGISQRLLKNTNKGYVKSFDDYAQDLNTFITDIVDQTPIALTQGVKPYLLSHSMGGAISLRLMELSPHLIQACVLSAPMIDINKGALPDWFAKVIVGSGNTLNQWFDDEPWYFFSQSDYKVKPFSENDLTHSPIRYQRFIDEYQSNKYIQLGGVTFQWLNEALKAKEQIFKQADKLSTPLLLIQASKDTVVSNQVQQEFWQLLNKKNPTLYPNTQFVVIKGAKHELFFESDEYRNQALEISLQWFDTQRPK